MGFCSKKCARAIGIPAEASTYQMAVAATADIYTAYAARAPTCMSRPEFAC